MKPLALVPLLLLSCSSSRSSPVDGSTRTVAGQFTTVFAPDGGGRTSTPTPPRAGTLTTLLAHGSGAGYQAFPVTVGADQSFSVSNVPAGPYFLRFERLDTGPSNVSGVHVELLELTTASPDLSVLVASRPDLVRNPNPSSSTGINLTATGLDPWAPGDSLVLASSQAALQAQYFTCGSSLRPANGATSFNGTLPWSCSFGSGFPSAAKADPVFFYQRAQSTVGTGASAANTKNPTRYARVTDLTVTDGSTANETVSLGAVPQSGSLPGAVQGSQFAALGAQVNPAAQPYAQGAFSMGIAAFPHSIDYPDLPEQSARVFLLYGAGDNSTDIDYGALRYGQFLDPQWKEYRFVAYQFDVVPTNPGSLTGIIMSQVPMSPPPTGPIVPVLGPPTAPLIAGKDGFHAGAGAGLQPRISWSAPTLGRATSYVVNIAQVGMAVAGEVRSITATLHSGTSFEVPAGLLRSGGYYQVTITAQQGPWDAIDHAPFRSGLPLHTADCVMGLQPLARGAQAGSVTRRALSIHSRSARASSCASFEGAFTRFFSK